MKNCTTKNHIKAEHKRHISERENQNQKLCTPMNRQYTHNALTTQKIVAVYFKDVKTEETPRPDVSGNNQFVTTTFFGQKINTAEIRFCNDR